MHRIKTIFLREIRSYFNSPVAYIVLIVFLTISGWFFAQELFLSKQASINGFLGLTPLLFLLIIPAISMSALAEEQKLGTMEILSTMPLKDYEIVLGKYLAILFLVKIGILSTLVYPITTSLLGNLDWGAVFASYIGLILLGASFSAIGIFASSLTKSQISAFIISLAICFFFFILGKILPVIPTTFVSFFEYLGIDYHYDSITRGVIDSRNIIYFLSIIVFFLSFTFYFLKRAKGRVIKGISVAIILAIIFVVNLLSYHIFGRIDLSEANVYSLSKASVRLIRNLENPIIIKSYITKELPAPYNRHSKYIKDILSEYRMRSHGKVKVEIINPEGQEGMMSARRAGVYPLQFTEVKAGEYGIKQGFMGLVFLYEDKKEVMPVIENLGTLEYDITSKIKKLTSTGTKTIGFTKGHNEVEPIEGVMRKLREQYEIKDIKIEEEDISPEVEVLGVLGPKNEFSKTAIDKIETFIRRGGKALFLIDKTNVNLDYFFAVKLQHPYLDTLLGKYGIKIEDGLVMDRQNQTIGITMQRGFFTMQNFIPYPFFPKATKFDTDNPIVRGLDAVVFPYVSAIKGGKPIAFSSKESWIRKDIQSVNPMDTERCFPFPFPFEQKDSYPLASYTDTLGTRILVVGTSKIVEQRFANAPGYTFFLNSVDWLAQDEDLIAIRSKGVSDRPIKELSIGVRNLLRYLNMLLPSLLVIAIGTIRWLKRRKK